MERLRTLLQKYRVYIFLVLIGLVIIALLTYVKNHTRPTSITLYGNVDVRQVELGFRVFGRVKKLFFEEGDWIKPGTLLALLEKKPYTDQEQEISAQIMSIKASLANEKKILQRRLLLIDSKSVSQEDLDAVSTTYKTVRAQLKQAKAALAIAKKNVRDTKIFAPTGGFILTRIREPGSIVAPGEPVYTLSITDPVWIRAFISEQELGLVFSGMKATIYTDTPGGSPYTGKVGFISPVAEFTPKTVETTQLRTDLVYRIRIYADNPDQGLRQGMPVTISLEIPPEAKKIPS